MPCVSIKFVTFRMSAALMLKLYEKFTNGTIIIFLAFSTQLFIVVKSRIWGIKIYPKESITFIDCPLGDLG